MTLLVGCSGPGDTDTDDAAGSGAGDAEVALSDGAWWRSGFVNRRSRSMHRPWNVGYTFYNVGDRSPQKWVDYMGPNRTCTRGHSTEA